ncbi:MAG: carbohydrate kinase [Clostridia bacterium]|nr:carbohydrate kinase [Clostridia bacterium]
MIVCIGEILADMIGFNKDGVISFNRYAGGAPFNVACDIKKLQGKAGFVGCVGNDLIGKFLLNYANNCGFDYLNIKLSDIYNTTLAFVELDEKGERSFSFYRKNTADYQLDICEVENAVQRANIVHLGSLMLSEEYGRMVADKTVELARKYNKLLSFDVNYRSDIFKSDEQAVKIYRKYLEQADIVKLSEDELYMFAGVNDLDKALSIMNKPNRVTLVTLGAKGSVGIYNGAICHVPTISVKVVDTTGAGDAFYAGALTVLDKVNISSLNEKSLEQVLKFGNVCGALTTSGYGAVDACPTYDEVIKYLK